MSEVEKNNRISGNNLLLSKKKKKRHGTSICFSHLSVQRIVLFSIYNESYKKVM